MWILSRRCSGRSGARSQGGCRISTDHPSAGKSFAVGAPAGSRGAKEVRCMPTMVRLAENARERPIFEGSHRQGRTDGVSPPTSAFGTTLTGLFLRPPTADRRAASPRIRAASLPTPRSSPPNFATPQSEPPALEDIGAPSPATRSRAYPHLRLLRRGFVPLSRGRARLGSKRRPGVAARRGRGGLADVYGPPFADHRGRSTRCEDQARRARRALPNRDTWATRAAAVRARASKANGFDEGRYVR
jgi:hypothetical protein